MEIEGITNAHRRLLLRHLRLFNHGLWPENSYSDYMQRFQAAPLKREGMPWTEEEDKQLLQLAEKYDANFGDPWLYLSWELQRDSQDVHKRYISLVVEPRDAKRRCEFTLTKCLKPLFFSRHFKLLPSFLFLVPKTLNSSPDKPLEVPAPFRAL
ncbi:hypothetical protein, conserved [Eimeria necatrix]|uniref:Myb-like domain-containing protein n=1 Tax=Eimeria necatrix TaxID=51315 RepID=U6MH17_9EIME|nr:hypothetical protein, conserved [Eimeria necatrix]CDJ62363.1 hypothetical protein, conserved [Eimeria necatrix]